MRTYKHTVHYYETDKMSVTHHSNYIRWMEEARVDFLKQIGWPFSKLEEMGLISPVVTVDCRYRLSTYFEDVITIKVKVDDFKGAKLKLFYEMTNEEGKVVCDGHSSHCFLDENGMPLRMAKKYPEFHAALVELIEK